MIDRNGRRREIRVSARRYADGAYCGSICVPAARGSTTHTIELSAPEIRQARELLADTRSAFRNALAQGRTAVNLVRPSDVVGGYESVDIVGELGRMTPFAGPDIIGGVHDIVGFDISQLFQAAGQIGGMVPGAGPIIQGVAGLAGQLAGAIQGATQGPRLTPEQQAAATSGVATGAQLAQRALEAAQAARAARESGASAAQQQAAAAESLQRSGAQALVESLRSGTTLPGVASAGSSSAAPPATAGASLGASELLSKALASLALERGSDQQALADAARVARTALRAVDARAAASIGDAQAREAIRRAVASTESRVARALRIALALTG